MDDMVKELRKVVPFKETTSEGDIVLIAIEKPKSILYALVENIDRDQEKREEWWNFTMHLLSVPPQKVTWILREPQFTGKEIFTMGNEGRFMQAVELNSPVPDKKAKKKVSQQKTPKKTTTLRRVK